MKKILHALTQSSSTQSSLNSNRMFSFGSLYRAVLLVACMMVLNAGWGQTYYNMSSGNYLETFTSWTSPTTGTNWSSVAVLATGTIPVATKTTVSSATFTTGISGGLQTGTTTLQFLSTGGTTNTNAVAFDLNLNFTNRNAGTFSFDAATVSNSTGDRPASLKVYYATDGATWTELTGTNLPYVATNNVIGSGSISITLPTALNNQSTVKLRFYNHNGTANTGTGSRPKISIDNVAVTSTPTTPSPTLLVTPSSLSFGNQNVATSSTGQSFSLSGTNLTGGSGNITVTAPSTDFQVSNDNSTWGGTTTISYTSATLTATPVYVRFNPTSAGAKTGNITFTGAGGVTTPPTVAVTGTGVTPALTVPVATAATLVSSTGFTANWNAVAGATGYFLDVSTSPTFGGSGTVTTTEGFNAAPTAPSGWTFTSIASYISTSTGFFGVAANSAKFDATGDQIVSPTASGTVTELKFWMRGASITGASALLVEGYNGTSWVTVQNITPISNTAATMIYNASTSPALPSNLTQFRFTYTKSGGNVAFDDYTITYNSSTPFFIPGYNNAPFSGTSTVLTGLDPLTTYYYRVRAHNGGTPTGNSNTIAVTTTCAVLPVLIPQGDLTMCAGTNNQLYASFGTYNPPILRWQVNTGTGWADVVLGSVYSQPDTPEFLNISNVPLSYSGYKYRLVANTGIGCDNFSPAATLIVTAPPAPPTITGESSVCMGSSLPLIGSATSGTSSWFISEPGVATISSPMNVPTSGIVSPVSVGMRIVTYRIIEGCISETTKEITVNAIPATPTITGASVVCMGSTTTLTGSTTTGTFAWGSSATGVATVSGGVVSPVMAGSTNITYTVTESLCSSTATQAVTVNAAPTTPTITGASAVCMGASLPLTGSATSGTFAWLTSTGSVATVSGSGLVLPVSAGMSTITYRVTEATGCNSETTKVVTVNAIPTLVVTAPPAVCAPTTVDLTAAAVTAGSTSGATFSYYLTANQINTLSNPSMVASSGPFYMKASLAGCHSSIQSVTPTVHTPTLAGGTGATNMTLQCDGGPWSYYGPASGSLYFAIQWGTATNATAKANAQVDVTVNPSMYSQEAGNDATYIMKRVWDVHHQTSGQTLILDTPVNIRFFFDQAEKDAVTNAAAAYLAAHPGTAKPFAWFKTNDGTGAFDASSMLAPIGLSGCYILPSATEGTMNGVKYVEITGVTGFSGGSAGAGVGAATILPVTLANFRATKKQQSIELQWKTASEQNANRFIVEKSTDGIHFKAMAEVVAVGNSKEAQTYNQLDKNPSQGDNYYRLLLKDNDGSSRHIGNIVKVNFLDANSVVSIYPNPVSDALTVQTSQTEAANLQLRIMDISGQLIQTIEYNVEQGNNSKILDVHTLRAGTYLLQVVDENQAQVSISRFVKM